MTARRQRFGFDEGLADIYDDGYVEPMCIVDVFRLTTILKYKRVIYFSRNSRSLNSLMYCVFSSSSIAFPASPMPRS